MVLLDSANTIGDVEGVRITGGLFVSATQIRINPGLGDKQDDVKGLTKHCAEPSPKPSVASYVKLVYVNAFTFVENWEHVRSLTETANEGGM